MSSGNEYPGLPLAWHCNHISWLSHSPLLTSRFSSSRAMHLQPMNQYVLFSIWRPNMFFFLWDMHSCTSLTNAGSTGMGITLQAAQKVPWVWWNVGRKMSKDSVQKGWKIKGLAWVNWLPASGKKIMKIWGHSLEKERFEKRLGIIPNSQSSKAAIFSRRIQVGWRSDEIPRDLHVVIGSPNPVHADQVSLAVF